MKILLANRGKEYRHIELALNKLSQKHQIDVYQEKEMQKKWYFEIGRHAEDYQFYKQMPAQGDYWKNRIFDDFKYPQWLAKLPLSFLKKIIKPSKEVLELVSKYDLIISTSLFLSPLYSDYEIILAAKQLKKPLIGFVNTWDTPTTKCKLQVEPDLMFCWNEQHKQELIKYHGLKEDKICPIGSYTHEKWLSVLPMRKDKFIKKVNEYDHYRKTDLKLNDKLITYLCSSSTIIGSEKELIIDLANQNKDSLIAVKVHPNKVWYLETDYPENVIHVPTALSAELYAYSDKIYGINTSAMLEAMLVGAKVYNIGEDPSNSLHFKALKSLLDGEGRHKIRQWMGFQDKKPSQLFVEKIESMLLLK